MTLEKLQAKTNVTIDGIKVRATPPFRVDGPEFIPVGAVDPG